MTVVTGHNRPPRAGPGSRARERRTWWLAFALLVVATGSWALAAPVMTGPDEAAHATRAAAVARGEFVGSRGLWANVQVEVQVPEAYAVGAQASLCFLGEPYEDTEMHEMGQAFGSLGCPEVEGGPDEVGVLTYEQRGQPLYYGLVGLPSLRWTGGGGVILGRLVGAVACAAALASALVSALRLPRPHLAVLAVAAATTPTVVYLAGMVNSAGPENALALCAWASGLALVRSTDDLVDRRLVARTAAALALLAVTRGFSPLYVLAIGAVLVAVARPGRVRALLAHTDVRLGAAAVAAGGLASAAWLWHIEGRLTLAPRAGSGWAEATGQLWWFSRHAVAVFSFNDVVPPVALHAAWVAVALGVVVAGLRRARRRHVAAVVGLLVATEALQVSAEGLSFPPTGFWWQGRYVLPLLVGVVVAAAAVADGGGDAVAGDGARARRLGPPVLAGLVALQVWAFLYAARHYAVGFDGPAWPTAYLTDPDWSSPYGPAWLFALTLTAALGALAALGWRAADAAATRPTAAPGGRSDDDDGPDHDDAARAAVPEPAVRT